MSNPSPTTQQVADAYQCTGEVLTRLSDICIAVEVWPEPPSSEQTGRFRSLLTELFGDVGRLEKALLPLGLFVDELEIGAFEGVAALGKETHRTLALGTALREDEPWDAPLSIQQARQARACIERLRAKDLAEMKTEANRAFRRACKRLTTPQQAEVPAVGTEATPRRKRRRGPRKPDPKKAAKQAAKKKQQKEDRRLRDMWKTGQYKTIDKLADEEGMDEHEVRLSLDRERHRIGRLGKTGTDK